jgi:GSH-dependent disulfide-bond oxidoreductase
MIEVSVTSSGGSPNVYKILLLLEETGLPYRVKPIDVSKGEQFDKEFLKIGPNNKVPTIIDFEPADGGAPLSVFESGAIMIYLADKAGRFLAPPSEIRLRTEVTAWVIWQVANLGPYMGQLFHFMVYAPEKIPYALTRYSNEIGRLYGVLERRLAEHAWLATDQYSIADMASFAATAEWRRTGHDFSKFPRLLEWRDRIEARPAYARAYDTEKYSKATIGADALFEKSTWKRLFQQNEDTIENYQQEKQSR